MKKVKYLAIVLLLFSTALIAQKKKSKVVYKKTESGILYCFFENDSKITKPKVGDKIRVALNYLNNKDSLLFDSNDPKLTQGKKYIEFELAPSTFKGSFEDALMMMNLGDSASFKVNADSVFLKTFNMKEVPAYIEKGSLLTFNVKLLDILTSGNLKIIRTLNDELEKSNVENAKLKEELTIQKYIKEKKITVEPTNTGLYFIPITKSKNKKIEKAQKGDTVVVNYVGRLLNGKAFDTNIESIAKTDSIYNEQGQYKPLDLPFSSGNVIPGWDQGVELMTVGSKAQFIIPSNLAYGENGLGDIIPPFSPLIFEVELLEIKSGNK